MVKKRNSSMAGKAKNMASSALKKAKKKAHLTQAQKAQLKKRAEEGLRKAQTQYKKTEKKVREYIRSNPEKAALVAAGLGVLVGRALKRGRK